MANSAKTNVEVSFKKNPRLNPKNMFQKICCLKRVPSFALATFNFIIFSGNFNEIHQASQEIGIFTCSILTIFIYFLNLLTSTCYKN